MKVLLVGGSVEKNEMATIAQGLQETGYSVAVHQFQEAEGSADDSDGLIKTVIAEKPDIVFPRKNTYFNPAVYKLGGKIDPAFITEHMLELGIPVAGWVNNSARPIRNKARCESIIYDAKLGCANEFILVDPNGSACEYGGVVDSRGFSHNEIKNPFQRHPVLFVKPNSLGRSAGIADTNVVHNMDELISRIGELSSSFPNTRILINPFYRGREFTVGVIGNNKLVVLPVQICQTKGYSQHKILLEGVKRGGIPTGKVYAEAIEEPKISHSLKKHTLDVCRTLEIQDYTRIDLKEDGSQGFHAIDINGVPGLKKMESYLAVAAEKAFEGQEAGYSIYGRLVSSVVSTAAERFNIKTGEHPTLFGLENKLFEN